MWRKVGAVCRKVGEENTKHCFVCRVLKRRASFVGGLAGLDVLLGHKANLWGFEGVKGGIKEVNLNV